MRIRHVVLVFVWMASVATAAVADTAKSIRVVDRDLSKAIETLAQQTAADVIYDPALVRGRTTQGVTGTLQPMEAFKKLLDGTELDVQEEGGALLITKAATAPTPARRLDVIATPADEEAVTSIDEVTVAATRADRLSTMYVGIDSLKRDFYKAYNRLNDDTRYDVVCRSGLVRLDADLIVRGRACSPKGKTTCSGGENSLCTFWPPKGYCKHLREIVERYPELREMLEQFNGQLESYGEVRGEELKDRITCEEANERPRGAVFLP